MNLRTLRKEFLKQRDVAVLLGIPISKLTQWYKKGVGPKPFEIDSDSIYYLRRDLISFIKNDFENWKLKI